MFITREIYVETTNKEHNFNLLIQLVLLLFIYIPIHRTKTTAAQNEVALSHRSVRGLHFLAVVFVSTIGFIKWFMRYKGSAPQHPKIWTNPHSEKIKVKTRTEGPIFLFFMPCFLSCFGGSIHYELQEYLYYN